MFEREEKEKEGETERPFFRQSIMLLKTIVLVYLNLLPLEGTGKRA